MNLSCPQYLITCGDDDRLAESLKQLAQVGIYPTVFECEKNSASPERGCYDAHQKLFRHILKEKVQHFVVFEDNVCVTRSFDGKSLQRNIEYCIRDNVGYVSLCRIPNVCMERMQRRHPRFDVYTRKKQILCQGTRAYFASIDMARAILELGPYKKGMPIDYAMADYWRRTGTGESFVMYPSPFSRRLTNSIVDPRKNATRWLKYHPRLYTAWEMIDFHGYLSIIVIVIVVILILLFVLSLFTKTKK